MEVKIVATSSFFKPLVVRQQDEAAWVKAFDTTEKIKRNKNYTINKLNKEAGRKVLEQIVRNSCWFNLYMYQTQNL